MSTPRTITIDGTEYIRKIVWARMLTKAEDEAARWKTRAMRAEAHVRSLIDLYDEGAACDCWRCNQATCGPDRCAWAVRMELSVEAARRSEVNDE